jgi:hypothetical protein
MNQRLTLGAISLALTGVILTFDGSGARASVGKTYALHAQNHSGEYGTVTLTPKSPTETLVVVKIVGGNAFVQPAHIHPGTCAKLNPAPKYPLHNVVDGMSSTTIDEPIAMLAKSGFAVNVHKSTTDLPTYVACGNL